MRRNRKTNDHTRSPDALERIGGRRVLELDPDLDPWDQQPHESPRNYGLFLLYRDAGRGRTVQQTAEASPLVYGSVARLSRCNKWVERAQRWDAEQERLTHARLEAAREDMARRHANAAQRLMAKALARLETLDISKISPQALVLMFDAAARIERASLGLDAAGRVTAAQAVTVTATTTTDATGATGTRVEVGVMRDRIMTGLDALISRMSPEQIAAGYEEMAAATAQVTAELDAALPLPPPPGEGAGAAVGSPGVGPGAPHGT